MKIALDYDGTYTQDPVLWGAFILQAEARGHEVFCITNRFPDQVAEIACPVFYTSMDKKGHHAVRMGLKPDIWIDDHPERIY